MNVRVMICSFNYDIKYNTDEPEGYSSDPHSRIGLALYLMILRWTIHIFAPLALASIHFFHIPENCSK